MRPGTVVMIVSVIAFSSCSLFREAQAPGSGSTVIRYVNIKYIYDFLINKNKDTQELAKKKETAIGELKQIEHKMKEPNANAADLALQYSRKKMLYAQIEKEEESYKSKISQQINRALTSIAEQTGADYILNIGDEVIYAKKKFDITEDVIREIIEISKKSDPVSR